VTTASREPEGTGRPLDRRAESSPERSSVTVNLAMRAMAPVTTEILAVEDRAQKLMYAGAPRVVASLWQVSDVATAELMKKFYTGMLQRRQPRRPRCGPRSWSWPGTRGGPLRISGRGSSCRETGSSRATQQPPQSPARRSVTARRRRLHDTVAAPPQSARAAPGHRYRHRRLARARPEPRSRGWYADPRHQGLVEP
jgi:hypothetical protein